MSTLVLASASPRRRELLNEMGVEFTVQTSSVDESAIAADHPRTFALRAAYAKARDVADHLEEETWVLAADTVVTRKMMLYGKPLDERDARRMLAELSGDTHQVITGVALAQAGSMKTFLRAETTQVTFRELMPPEIEAYLATGEPFDKAGAYGIQGEGGGLVARIDGDYFNVVGLPCEAVVELFEEADLGLKVKVPLPPERWR